MQNLYTLKPSLGSRKLEKSRKYGQKSFKFFPKKSSELPASGFANRPCIDQFAKKSQNGFYNFEPKKKHNYLRLLALSKLIPFDRYGSESNAIQFVP